MVRTPSFDKRGMKKGSWTPEEDRKLIAYVTRYGCWNWRQLPRFAGLARCGKSCRLRWMNYLKPDIKRGDYTQEEEDTIVRLHHKLGSKWSVIAANLPGRTDNDIKNHWHSSLKKRFQRNAKAVAGENDDDDDDDSSSKEAQVVTPQTPYAHSGPPVTSPQLSSTELSNTTPPTHHSQENNNNNLAIDDDLDFLDEFMTQAANEIIWSEPSLAENNGNGTFERNSDTTQISVDSSPQSSSAECFVNGENDEHLAFVEPTTAAQLAGIGDFWGEQWVVADLSPSRQLLSSESPHDFLCPGYDVNIWS